MQLMHLQSQKRAERSTRAEARHRAAVEDRTARAKRRQEQAESIAGGAHQANGRQGDDAARNTQRQGARLREKVAGEGG